MSEERGKYQPNDYVDDDPVIKNMYDIDEIRRKRTESALETAITTLIWVLACSGAFVLWLLIT